MQIKFKKIKPEAVLPNYAHESDAGFDLFCLEDKTLKPGEQYNFSIGLQSEIPDGHFVQINPKSGLAVKNGIDTLAGVIDSGYRGEWVIAVVNFGHEPYTFKKGDKIAQGILLPLTKVKIVEVKELTDSERGSKAFGSSGR